MKEVNKVLIEEIGKAQKLLPAHVVNEFCYLKSRFFASPSSPSPFRSYRIIEDDSQALLRTRIIVMDKKSILKGGQDEWFSALCEGRGSLGETFAIHGNSAIKEVPITSTYSDNYASPECYTGRIENFKFAFDFLESNRQSVQALSSTRLVQYEKLIKELNLNPRRSCRQVNNW